METDCLDSDSVMDVLALYWNDIACKYCPTLQEGPRPTVIKGFCVTEAQVGMWGHD